MPPPVVRGRVPRNAYGNLDVYVPSMVPPGGSHIKHHEAARAARMLNIDYVDAITGFQFKGRRGTAINEGIVVAEQYQEAVDAVIEGLVRQKEEIVGLKRTKDVLRMWKRFMVGLKIVDHVRGYGSGEDEGVRESSVVANGNDYDDDNDVNTDNLDAEDAEATGGGFLPYESEQLNVPIPSTNRYVMEVHSTKYLHRGSYGEGELVPEVESKSADEETSNEIGLGGGFIVNSEPEADSTKPISTIKAQNNSELKVSDELGRSHIAISYYDNAINNENTEFSAEGKENRDKFITQDRADYSQHRQSPHCSPVKTKLTAANSASSPIATDDEPRKDIAPESGSAQLPFTTTLLARPTESLSRKAEAEAKTGLKTEATGKESEDIMEPTHPKYDAESDNDSQFDKGSLLSQDPEDEDAEPEWLASD